MAQNGLHMDISIFTVTPEIAEKILSLGDPNFRDKNKSRVKIYSEEMLADRQTTSN